MLKATTAARGHLGACLDKLSILIHHQVGDLTKDVGKDGQ